MFVVLFVAPLAQTVLLEETSFVLQELEDVYDAEEGEMEEINDAQKTYFHLGHTINFTHLEDVSIEYHMNRINLIFATNRTSVETPPPQIS